MTQRAISVSGLSLSAPIPAGVPAGMPAGIPFDRLVLPPAFLRRTVPNARPLRQIRPLQPLPALLEEIRACHACAEVLPLGPRPVLQASATSRLLIVGQAPGAKVHASGIPWDDASGERLRAWLGIDSATFYDASRVALVPMGFCYPGRGGGGDNPPRPECAPLWHEKLIGQLTNVRLTLLVGQYAQRYFLGNRRKASLTETVAAWREYAPDFVPLPHPSPRNQPWLKRHPWFGHDVLPALQERVGALLASTKPRARDAQSARKDSTMTKPAIDIQRVYEPLPEGGHHCFLVDRLWPRGLSKEKLANVEWLKEVAPSTALRQWFHKDPEQWTEFRKRYLDELNANPDGWQPLAEAAAAGHVTLLYGSHDTQRNHAIVLREYLEKKLQHK
ncbi:uracil-DNA glycosylase [Paraburkholderia unamae]|uniref:Uracil-DNA glycosylase n=2 Tax=Paraburkholderia unamae TaxID=219649 RepID=A0ABX5KU72_9BURK|nr:uracil-DNA glycosylase [Paraburkholderia unamae]CAG9274197.1 Uracil-DNA glycosylase [Paraburkholderia unamae]